MPGGDPLPVDTLAARLRARVSGVDAPSLRLVRSPGPTIPLHPDLAAVRQELAAVRAEIKAYAVAEGERRGAWGVMRPWLDRLIAVGAGYALAKVLEILT